MNAVLCVTLLSAMLAACGKGQGVPRPLGLPANVPDSAVITHYGDHKQGGLLQISWGHTSMLWAEPCRTVESAVEFARGSERLLGCPAELDMKIRPLYLGTLNAPLTTSAQQGRSPSTCCYTFQVLGNR